MTAGNTSATVMPLSLLNACNRTDAEKGPRSLASIVYGLAWLFLERLIFSRCDANRPSTPQRSLCVRLSVCFQKDCNVMDECLWTNPSGLTPPCFHRIFLEPANPGVF